LLTCAALRKPDVPGVCMDKPHAKSTWLASQVGELDPALIGASELQSLQEISGVCRKSVGFAE
jgi:hypothetical protein